MPLPVLHEFVDANNFCVGLSVFFILLQMLVDFDLLLLSLLGLECYVISPHLIEALVHFHREVLQNVKQVQVFFPIEFWP